MSLGKRVLKWTFLIVPWVLALLLAVGWGLATWTPEYLEELIPEIAKEMELPLEQFQVRNAGLFSADIGPVQLGTGKASIKLNNINVAYTPASLKQGRVKTIIIHGVELEGSFDGTSFNVPLLDMFAAGEKQNGGGKQPVPDLPFDTLHVRNSILHVQYMGTRISFPFSVVVTPGKTIDFNGTAYFRDQAITITGSQGPLMDNLSLYLMAENFRLGSLADLLPLPVGGSMDLDLSADIDLSQPQNLESTVHLSISEPDLSCLGITLDPGKMLDANATISKQTIALSLAPVSIVSPHPASISIPEAHLSKDELRADFILNTAGLTMPGTLNAARDNDNWDITLDAANPAVMQMKTEGRAIRLGGVTLSIKGTASTDSADIAIETSTRNIALKGTPLRTGRVNLKLPLAWPTPKRGRPGRLTLTNVRSGKYKLGSITTRLRQEFMDIGYNGELATELLPNLRLPFSGHASMETRDATLKFGVDRYALPHDYDPVKLVPALGGIRFSGNLSMEGGVDISHKGIESRLGIFLTDGVAKFGDSGTTMKGIRLYFESPDIINFRSSPAQMFAFDSLTAGTLDVKNGLVTFQLEPGGVVLVERGRVEWCDGHVESRAFRVIPGHDEYDVTLFCTGLKLTEILHQLGLAKAKGDSALDGELPVTWREGHISFAGGFLHSTPGEGGSIQVEGLDELLASIPEGTPQRGQLELAKHAIKDFEYKWVRIRADTVGNELLVRLSVDGKPVGVLPFVYRKEIGGFMMVEGDVQGSHFQGLRLDVNFNLPLDRILLYKDLIKRIE
ncbi:MAG: YdbH domain-containing protein [Pseudodesulfovibrio sp.]